MNFETTRSDLIGYGWLVEHFSLNVCELLETSFHTGRTQRMVETDGIRSKTYYPKARYPLESTWSSHLRFAMRYEGVKFEVLKAFFLTVDEVDLVAFLREKPTSGLLRRIWFFYEFLTGRRLPLPDCAAGNYVDAVDADWQLALPRSAAVKERRYRVNRNLLGTSDFLPYVRLVMDAPDLSTTALQEQAEKLVSQYSSELLYRSVQYLYAKETRSSFAIERETPTQRHMNAFVSLLTDIPSRPLSRETLVSVQNQVVDPRYAQRSWRTSQVYVGETLTPLEERVHYIAPRPNDLSSLMDGFLSALDMALAVPGQDPVVLAAAMSFAFVFLHPFDDGNGRVHRYLMHAVLARLGFTPPHVLFPVSATLLKNPLLYDDMLESFSRRVMARLEYRMDAQGEIMVTQDSADFYRFIDYTPIVREFRRLLRETMETEWRGELDYLAWYDRIRSAMRGIVDMPDKKANQFITFCQQNGGRLSKTKRPLFQELSDEEIASLEAIVQGGAE